MEVGICFIRRPQSVYEKLAMIRYVSIANTRLITEWNGEEHEIKADLGLGCNNHLASHGRNSDKERHG